MARAIAAPDEVSTIHGQTRDICSGRAEAAAGCCCLGSASAGAVAKKMIAPAAKPCAISTNGLVSFFLIFTTNPAPLNALASLAAKEAPLLLGST